MRGKPMTERDLQDIVIQTARLYQWQVSHFRPARTERGWRTPVEGDKGFPDLVLARDGVVLIVELKAQRGRLSPEQVTWGKALGECYRLWRPADIPAIVAELKRTVRRPSEVADLGARSPIG